MMDALNSFCLSIMDLVLGWLLHLPQDVALLFVAIGTALILTVVRLFTTDQKHLKRCKDDKARLKQLMREAKKKRDKEALARYRLTMGQIGMENMKAEGKPLLASIVPIALMAIWAFGHIAYVAPKADDPITVRAYTPVSRIGKLLHVVPQEGVEDMSGWYKRVLKDDTFIEPAPAAPAEGEAKSDKEAESDKKAAPPEKKLRGVACWTFRREKPAEPCTFDVCYRGKTSTQKLVFDETAGAAPPASFEGRDPVWRFSRAADPMSEAAERVTLTAYFPGSELGTPIHIVPQDGLQPDPGWVQKVEADTTAKGETTNGLAEWTFRCRQSDQPYKLLIRYRDETYKKDLIVDGVRYSEPLKPCEGKSVQMIETVLPEYKLLGIVPGLPWIMLQPWIVGYLIIVLPFSLILKPVLRIY